MMKKQQEQEIYELEEFSQQVHLWNLIPGGSGKPIVMLRKIVDSIQAENYSKPYRQLPSFMIVGEEDTGNNLIARALVNSLAIEDIRESPGQYLDNGIPSSQFFKDSLFDTAHIITNIEQLSKIGESVLWKYLKLGTCKYYNYATRNYDLTLQCNGMIVMTAREKDKLSEAIRNAVDHIIELEPYTQEQLKIISHQLLKFCGIEYDGELVLQEIVDQGFGKIGQVIEFLKICLMLMKAEMYDCLDMEVVERAKMLWLTPVPAPPLTADDDIPF